MQSRKTNEGKKKKNGKGEDGDERLQGDYGLSIRPGPGELVHPGHHPPEVQSLPEKLGKKRYDSGFLLYFIYCKRNIFYEKRKHLNR